MFGWSEAICHMREPRQPLKASAPVEEVKVIYQFFYQNRARVLSESRPNPRCIWCDRLFKSVKDLLTHLKASHDKFTYSTPESKAIANGMKLTSVHIEVTKFLNRLDLEYLIMWPENKKSTHFLFSGLKYIFQGLS